MPTEVSRAQVLAFRWHAHQLDRACAAGPADCDLLDLGIQDARGDGASWALRVRGTPPDPDGALVFAWTLRGAPHCYRRADLPAVAVATRPLSEADADAGKRIFDANKPLKAAGIPALSALHEVATKMREIVVEPTVKGAMSTALTERLPDPYRRFCRPCNAVHLYEMPFRLAALQAGLSLQPGTSPPVLERALSPISGPASGADAQPRFDVIRGFLRFFGPGTPKQAAAYIDAPVKDVKAHWPTDLAEVTVADEPRWVLGDDLAALTDPPTPAGVRLLGPFDPYLQLRDRELLVPDAGHRKELWPVLGRPGAIAERGEIIGAWRPRTAGRTLTVQVAPWTPLARPTRTAIEEQAQRLADHRGVTLGGVVE